MSLIKNAIHKYFLPRTLSGIRNDRRRNVLARQKLLKQNGDPKEFRRLDMMFALGKSVLRPNKRS